MTTQLKRNEIILGMERYLNGDGKGTYDAKKSITELKPQSLATIHTYYTNTLRVQTKDQ